LKLRIIFDFHQEIGKAYIVSIFDFTASKITFILAANKNIYKNALILS